MNIAIFHHDRFLFYFIIIIYDGTIILSILFYSIFKLIYEDEKINI
jgi:hypothetical protein